jgi:TolB protein
MRLVLAVTACVFLLAAPAAQADDYIPVEGAQFKPLSIAVEQTVGDTAPADEFTSALRDDLALCGFFDVLNAKSFLIDPAKEPSGVTQIDFTKWRAVGAFDVEKANLHLSGGDVTVEAWLFDATIPSQLLHASFTGKVSETRTLAHRWANMIVKQVTGSEGYFLTRIAYVKPNGHNGKDIWVSDLDGRHAVDLTPDGGLNLLPAWSPDGRKVAFTSYRSGSPMLYVVDTGTRFVTALPQRGSLETGAAFSPDGKRIAFTSMDHGSANIFVVGADGTDLRQVTDTRDTNSSPCWSPDGKRIAFVSTRSGDPQVFAMSSDGLGPVERLTFEGRYNQTPDWSPRGDEIAFTARDERHQFDLFIVDLARTQQGTPLIRRLTQDSGRNEEPSFSPNGNSILFTSNRAGRMQLWVMNRDGTNQRPLPIEGEAMTPAWGPIP